MKEYRMVTRDGKHGPASRLHPDCWIIHPREFQATVEVREVTEWEPAPITPISVNEES